MKNTQFKSFRENKKFSYEEDYRFDTGADILQLGVRLKSEEQTSPVLVSGTPRHGIASPWQSVKTWRELKKYFISVYTQSIF